MYDPKAIPANLLPGHLISRARKKKDMSQKDLAEATGMTQQTVSRWENGIHKVTVEHVSLLVAALDVDRDELLRAIQLQAEYSKGDVLHTRPDTVLLQAKVEELEGKVAQLIELLQRNDR